MKGKKGNQEILLFFVFFVVALGVVIFLNRYRLLQVFPQSVPAAKTKQVLVSGVPNFETLKISDLPNFSDVRRVEKYKNNVIVSGFSRIVEYDPVRKTIIRQSNDLIPEITSTALIGDYLYVSGEPSSANSEPPPARKIFVIDLRSGAITKTLFENAPERYVNLDLLSQGKTLWGSSWNGVFRMDTDTGDVVIYDHAALHVPVESCPAGLFMESGKINLMSNCYETGFRVYNPDTDTWTIRKPTSPEEYSSKINKTATDFELELPKYLAISPLRNGMYYLFADLGVYTLKKDGFPILFAKERMREGMVDDLLAKTLISRDGAYVLLVSANLGMYAEDAPLSDRISVYLLSTSTKQLVNLIELNPEYTKPVTSTQMQTLMALSNPENTILKETEGGAVVVSAQTQETIMTVDFAKRMVTF